MIETTSKPSDLIIQILRYKKEWLDLDLKKEESIARQGILADDMRIGEDYSRPTSCFF